MKYLKELKNTRQGIFCNLLPPFKLNNIWSSSLFKIEVKARDQLYMAADQHTENELGLKLCKIFARIGIPVMVVLFQIVYWTVGNKGLL